MSATTSNFNSPGDPNAGPIDLSDPFGLFGSWFAEAGARETAANAMSLATAGDDGWPDLRIVLLNGLDGADAPPECRGFVFYTNMGSAKAVQIQENRWVSLCFHWKSLNRQVRIMGEASLVGDVEADAYFATRPRQAQIGAWASYQSQPLESRELLERRVNEFAARFPDTVPRPEFWSGIRVVPIGMEFWRDRHFRLHDRFLFTREAPDGPWTSGLLYP
ncbi:MAG: pyridoxamine 5'-phosphate oxidase [Alphaproteobacteria bacterium]|nr:pyridoxamine 5'-phosphate oxidase [Alphaproteobacteria bacterium]